MSSSRSIDKLADRLDRWRRRKRHKGEKTPEPLVRDILEAIDTHCLEEVRRKLKIRTFQIDSWRSEYSKNPRVVRVASPIRPDSQLRSDITHIQIRRCDGVTLQMRCENSSQTQTVIHSFVTAGVVS